MQGKVYFDFFLFDPHVNDNSASELKLINLLINSGKERLLIHPIFEVNKPSCSYIFVTLRFVYL